VLCDAGVSAVRRAGGGGGGRRRAVVAPPGGAHRRRAVRARAPAPPAAAGSVALDRAPCRCTLPTPRPAQVLAPESAVPKLGDTVRAAGAALLPVEPGLFAGALLSDDQARAEAAAAAAAGGAGAERAASHAAAGFSGRGGGGAGTVAGDGALIIYTSGTTGRPKGALHTHGWARARRAGGRAPAAAGACRCWDRSPAPWPPLPHPPLALPPLPPTQLARGPDQLPRRRVALGALGPHPPRAAAAPHPRNRQRAALRARGGRVRRLHGVVPARRGLAAAQGGPRAWAPPRLGLYGFRRRRWQPRPAAPQPCRMEPCP
jgi:hypothetical protein